jgi:hypothetical protein
MKSEVTKYMAQENTVRKNDLPTSRQMELADIYPAARIDTLSPPEFVS